MKVKTQALEDYEDIKNEMNIIILLKEINKIYCNF